MPKNICPLSNSANTHILKDKLSWSWNFPLKLTMPEVDVLEATRGFPKQLRSNQLDGHIVSPELIPVLTA